MLWLGFFSLRGFSALHECCSVICPYAGFSVGQPPMSPMEHSLKSVVKRLLGKLQSLVLSTAITLAFATVPSPSFDDGALGALRFGNDSRASQGIQLK